jgi:hypothetical protein
MVKMKLARTISNQLSTLRFFRHFSDKEKDEARPDSPGANQDSLNAFILRFAGG